MSAGVTQLLERALALASPASASGRHLELLKGGLPIRSGSTGNAREAILAAVLTDIACLSLDELQVAILRCTGYSDGIRTYFRQVWASDLVLCDVPGGLPEKRTLQGETYIKDALDERGRLIPNRVVVQGQRRILMSIKDIAKALGITNNAARTRWDAALEKLRLATEVAKQAEETRRRESEREGEVARRQREEARLAAEATRRKRAERLRLLQQLG